MFSAINFGKALMLVFACVMPYAGSSSAGQLKVLLQPVVLDMLNLPNNRLIVLSLLYFHRF